MSLPHDIPVVQSGPTPESDCNTCGKSAKRIDQLKRSEWECSHIECPKRRLCWSGGTPSMVADHHPEDLTLGGLLDDPTAEQDPDESYAEYERQKLAFINSHPFATPEEIEAAFQDIATGLGL